VTLLGLLQGMHRYREHVLRQAMRLASPATQLRDEGDSVRQNELMSRIRRGNGGPFDSPPQRRHMSPNQTGTRWKDAALPTQGVIAFRRLSLSAFLPQAVVACIDDCNNDNMLIINEVLVVVNIALGNQPVAGYVAEDRNGYGTITVEEIPAAVANALNGCSGVESTPIPTPGAASHSDSACKNPACREDDLRRKFSSHATPRGVATASGEITVAAAV
jgi:hypothetical protein